MKLGIVKNGNLSSIDFYRTVGFWPYFVDVGIMDRNEVNWWNVPQYDVVLVSRPIGVSGLRACQIVKELGKPLWLDYDDDLLNLPEEFDADKEDIRYHVEESMKLADLVICSTESVAEMVPGKKVVRKNLFNDFIFKFEPKMSPNRTFGFRGTERVHAWNVAKFKTIFEEGDWIFWGGGMKEFYGTHLKELPFIDYMVSLRTRSPGVIVKPLADIPHNRAKSNCTWLEATYAGAVCLAPDWPEWREEGIINYKEVSDCKELMRKLINDEEWRMWLFEKSVKTIKEKYLLSNFKFNYEEYGLKDPRNF